MNPLRFIDQLKAQTPVPMHTTATFNISRKIQLVFSKTEH